MSWDYPIEQGTNVFVRTVTNYFTGRLTAVGPDWIRLDDASWIASTKRLFDSLKDGVLDEVEPYPSWVIVGRGAIVDIAPWSHDLPRKQQ